jgi:pilus assembly protein CpaC
MKKIILLLGICLNLLANDILVFTNEYQVLELPKKVKKLIVGNKDTINVSLLGSASRHGTKLKIFGKKNGNTSILIIYRDKTIENHHVYVNENLGFIEKMVNVIEPSIKLSRVGNGSTVMAGTFKDPHNKQRILDILQNGGINTAKLMDLTTTAKVNKMIRTKLYLVEINNQKAKDLGGVTGLGFFNKYLKMAINPNALNAATFSGFLLDNTAAFTAATGNSVVGTLNFLEKKGIANILDDTVLITTEDKNASFRVGGEVYIPVGLTQNVGFAPTIQVEEREYGLRLTLTSHFMEINNYMQINVNIKDSEFDTNKEHDVQLGKDIFVPSFVSKHMQTHIVVKSGQVIALGGRLHTEDADTEEKVPLLGDIPLIGELFKHTVAGKKTNDLIFFLVPEIVDANEDLDDTHFYQDFKDSSNLFHEQILKKNTPKEQTEPTYNDTNETVVIVDETDDINTSDENTSVSLAPLLQEQETPAENEIVLADDNTSIRIKELNTTTQESNTTLDKETNTTAAVTPAELLQKAPAAKRQTQQMFAITAQKVFLRDAPGNGKIVNVWILGHKFTVKNEVIKNGKIWLQVDQNCRQECKKVTQDYWIAKRYASQL